MLKFFKRVGHGFLFSYVFYYVMTRDLEYIYSYYATALKGG